VYQLLLNVRGEASVAQNRGTMQTVIRAYKIAP
jgi:hypothetical protein